MTTDGTASADLQKKYLDQVLKVLTSKESPCAEKIFNYSLARKIGAELDAIGWKPGSSGESHSINRTASHRAIL
jgi:hypothetical protein